eukprot:1083147-Alexandrium_andersonii.AAC.1
MISVVLMLVIVVTSLIVTSLFEINAGRYWLLLFPGTPTRGASNYGNAETTDFARLGRPERFNNNGAMRT